MTSNPPTLAACPNPECGSPLGDRNIQESTPGTAFWIECPACAVQGPMAETIVEAIRLWNLTCGGRGLAEKELMKIRFAAALLETVRGAENTQRDLRALAAKHQEASDER